VEVLLSHGANVNCKGDKGETPLYEAVQRGQHTTVEVLLNHGANVNCKDDKENTPLHEAAQYGCNKTELDVRLDEGKWMKSHYMYTVGQEDYHTIVELLHHGANVNFKHSGGNTPLHEAVRYGCHKTLKVLLRHGANVNLKDCRGNTPLHEAARYGYHKTVKVLWYWIYCNTKRMSMFLKTMREVHLTSGFRGARNPTSSRQFP